MTVIENISPKVPVVGPFSIGDVIPITFEYTNTDDIKIDVDGTNLSSSSYEVYLQGVTLKVAIDSGKKVTVYRDTPLDQQAVFPQNSKFDSAKINGALDKLCMQNQEQQENLNRSIKIPIAMTTEQFNGTLPTPIAKKSLKINDDGNGLAYSDYDADEAIALTNAARDKAKEWATSANVVESGLFSAKKYSENSANSASASANSASAAATSASQANTYKNNAATSASQALGYKNDTLQAKTDAVNTITAAQTSAVNTINSTKDTAVTTVNNTKTAGVTAVQQAQSAGVTALNNVKDAAIRVTGADVIAAQNAADLARESAAKAIGWDINYVDEDCLIFTDKTPAQINTNLNYIEQARVAAVQSVNDTKDADVTILNGYVTQANTAKTQAQTAATNAGNSATAAANSATSASSSANSADNAKNQTAADVETCTTQANLARSYSQSAESSASSASTYEARVNSAAQTGVTNINNASNTAVSTITTKKNEGITAVQNETNTGVQQIVSARTNAIQQVGVAVDNRIAAAQSIASSAATSATASYNSAQEAKEYAERARLGWDIQFADETLLFTSLNEE